MKDIMEAHQIDKPGTEEVMKLECEMNQIQKALITFLSSLVKELEQQGIEQV
jgi:hypothetical protein